MRIAALGVRRHAQYPTRFRLAPAMCSRLPSIVAQRTRELIYPLSAARRDGFGFTVQVQTGSRFTGSSADMVAYPVAVHGYFNWRNIAIARAVCQPGDAILEVGANVGSETVGFSDIVGAAGAVCAVEPVPSNVELLQLNANASRHRNITVLPTALSESEEELSFVAPSDAEGHEGSVLRGGREMLSQHRPVVVLEVLDELLRPQNSSSWEIAQLLRELDYVPFQISRLRIEELPQARERVPSASDWIALPAAEVELVQRIRRLVRRSGFAPCVAGLSPLKTGAQ
jgi:hypothetical protein